MKVTYMYMYNPTQERLACYFQGCNTVYMYVDLHVHAFQKLLSVTAAKFKRYVI